MDNIRRVMPRQRLIHEIVKNAGPSGIASREIADRIGITAHISPQVCLARDLGLVKVLRFDKSPVTGKQEAIWIDSDLMDLVQAHIRATEQASPHSTPEMDRHFGMFGAEAAALAVRTAES